MSFDRESMSMKAAIQKAVNEWKPALAGQIADKLRNKGWTYHEIFELVCQFTDIGPADWEALMYAADWEERDAP